MATMNDNHKPCDHDFVRSLTEAGVERCAWCPATRESPDASESCGVEVRAVPVGGERRAA